ncbi:MAG: Sec-independent protein translocase protein TatB [Novosphingobium sp.]|nr:Sec-independent protein translocase protein TatB [Novosphingobium sp.]
MFDVGASELLMIAVIAIIVIGPKDMPLALRTAGRWIAKVRRVSGHFHAGIETMIREAELEEMEKKWREQNEQIMAAHPHAEMEPLPPPEPQPEASAAAEPTPASAEAPAMAKPAEDKPVTDEPQLPLGGPASRDNS